MDTNKNISIEEKIKNYINILDNKCKQLYLEKCSSSQIRIKDIPPPININNYDNLLHYNFNIKLLKEYCKQYKLKLSGNKTELLIRLLTFLYLSSYALKIQKYIRGKLTRKYINLHGPAFKNRKLCTNETDFFTMEELTNIPSEQFFSYKDKDGFIYGFDIISLNNLIYNSNGSIKNPYNRHNISNDIIINLRSLLRLSNILNININTKIENVYNNLSQKQSQELRVVSLFQKMDELGNYTNNSWFMTLNIRQLNKLVRELMDVWSYRAPLTQDVRVKICPPSGKPFKVSLHTLGHITNIEELRQLVLEILETFVFSGIDNDSKSLGTYYVLGCLTLVNNDTAIALPWLFEAFNYMIN
jgi:hypothetical protein